MNDQDQPSEPRATSSLSQFKFTFPPWPRPAGLLSFEQFKNIGYQSSVESDEPTIQRDKEGPISSKNYYQLDDLGVASSDPSVENHEVYQATILQVKEIFGGHGIYGSEPEETRSEGFGPYNPQYDPGVRVYRATKEWEISRNQILVGLRAYRVVWDHWKHFAQIERVRTDSRSGDNSDDDVIAEIDEEGNISNFIDDLNDKALTDDAGRCRFLEDMEETVRLFLNSRSDPDLIKMLWSDERIDAAPKIILSFFKYLAAHDVLPEDRYISSIKETIEVLTEEIVNLDLSSELSQTRLAGPGGNDDQESKQVPTSYHDNEVAAGWGYDSETEEQ